MMNYIFMTLLILSGIVASITDIKERKIYNKHLIIMMIIGSLFYILSYKQVQGTMIAMLFNLGLSIVIGFLFYYFKIWAAGDAKFFMLIIFLIPYGIYEVKEDNLFPAFNVLSMTFSIAFLYICIETLYFKLKGQSKEIEVVKQSFSIQWVATFILDYLIGYNAILLVDQSLSRLVPNLYEANQGLLWLIHIFLMAFLFNHIIEKKQKLLFIGIVGALNIGMMLVTGSLITTMINYKYLLLVLIIIWIRNVASQYNYEVIKTEAIKPGMVLTYSTVMKFMPSRVKGLPKSTDETTKYRITAEEAEAIKRWQHSKWGEEIIVIVRHIPFAPFIASGAMLFILLKLYIAWR